MSEKNTIDIEFGVGCLGYSVGGSSTTFDIEIEKSEIENMTASERYEYIYEQCREYVINNLSIDLEL